MKVYLLAFLVFGFQVDVSSQTQIVPFPELDNYIPAEYLMSNNIYLIAQIKLNSSKTIVPIIYSMMHYTSDSAHFFLPGENIDHYSYKIHRKNCYKPLFNSKALRLPLAYDSILVNNKIKFNQAKAQVNLSKLIQFRRTPRWWQNDETPLIDNKTPMQFICQIELGTIMLDDCCMCIFYDSNSHVVKYIIQRD